MENALEKFSTDFYQNKLALKDLQIPFSPVNRNWLAGYITRKVKQKIEKDKATAAAAARLASKAHPVQAA